MKKQTAVEWQFEQLFNSFEKFNNGECTFNEFLKRNLEIREQAKAMGKQQIIDEFDGHPLIARNSQNGEEYYELTFNQK